MPPRVLPEHKRRVLLQTYQLRVHDLVGFFLLEHAVLEFPNSRDSWRGSGMVESTKGNNITGAHRQQLLEVLNVSVYTDGRDRQIEREGG